jgi:P-type conjugative transfer protein TrbL
MARRRTILSVAAVALATAATAHAQAPVDVGGTFQQTEQAANAWIPTIMQEASFLFYVLALLDFAWGAPQLLREHDFNGLFLSLIKKLLVISFFYAVLINGQTWIPAIVNSFAQLGANAAGVSVAQNPSDIMAQGLQIASDLFTKVSATNMLTEPGAAITTTLAACIVLASYIIITLHYVVTKLEAIIVMSAGYIFLGFGGSRWTSPYFERYISLAVSTGVRLMLIYLMLGVFTTISNNWIATMNGYTADLPITQIFPTLMSMLLFAFASWMIPKMAASIASGTLGDRRGRPGWHGRGDRQSGCSHRRHGRRGRGNRRSREPPRAVARWRQRKQRVRCRRAEVGAAGSARARPPLPVEWVKLLQETSSAPAPPVPVAEAVGSPQFASTSASAVCGGTGRLSGPSAPPAQSTARIAFQSLGPARHQYQRPARWQRSRAVGTTANRERGVAQ